LSIKAATAFCERLTSSAKSRAAFRGQGEFSRAAIGLRWFSRDDLASLQGLQGAAEESGIEPQRTDQIGRGAVRPLADFVNDPGFLQRPGTVQQLRFDDAELAGIEAVEGADRRDLVVGILRHGVPR
jgi:hypothetical protein